MSSGCFSYTMIPSVDGSWGVAQEDGTFNGMIGMILRGEAELGVSDFFITAGRGRVIDFSVGLGTAAWVSIS